MCVYVCVRVCVCVRMCVCVRVRVCEASFYSGIGNDTSEGMGQIRNENTCQAL